MNKLDLNQRFRFINCIKKAGAILGLGLAYYIFVLITHRAIPCVFKLITGRFCPGCGITRMFMELLKGNILEAMEYNMFVFWLLPLALVWGIYRFVTYVRNNNTTFSKVEVVFLIVVFLGSIAFWILRNTSHFSYLAPAG